jgi:putative Mn2+ efflux pump MntP
LFASDENPEKPKKSFKYYLYHVISIISTSFILNYCVIGFLVLSMENTFYMYKKLYFSGHIIGSIIINFLGLVYIVVGIMLPKSKHPHHTNKEKKE